MSSLDQLISEVADAARLVRHRPTMATSIIKSLAKKIENLSCFSTPDCTRLVIAIEQTSLNEDQRDVLKVASDSKLSVSLSNDQLGPVLRGGAPPRDQCIRYLFNYPRMSDWASLDDPRAPPSSRDVVMAKLCSDLGIRHASEEGLVKWCIVILTHIENSISGVWPTYAQIYDRVATPPPSSTLSRHPASKDSVSK